MDYAAQDPINNYDLAGTACSKHKASTSAGLFHLGCWWTAVKATFTGQNPLEKKCLETAPLALLLNPTAKAAVGGCILGIGVDNLETSKNARLRKLGYVIDAESFVHDLADILGQPEAFSKIENALHWLEQILSKGR